MLNPLTSTQVFPSGGRTRTRDSRVPTVPGVDVEPTDVDVNPPVPRTDENRGFSCPHGTIVGVEPTDVNVDPSRVRWLKDRGISYVGTGMVTRRKRGITVVRSTPTDHRSRLGRVCLGYEDPGGVFRTDVIVECLRTLRRVSL